MKILIATVTAGGGHLQAAAALDEAWREFRPEDTLERVDLLSLVPRLQRQVYAQGYVRLVEHAPELWGLMFKKTDNPAFVRKLTRFRRAVAAATNRRFVRQVKRLAPDVVLCTHFLPVEVMGELERHGQKPVTVCVVTDFEAHALWLEQAVDLYCVAAEETRTSLIARGVEAQRVLATGIPVSPRFHLPVNAEGTRRSLGLRDDLPTLLVLSGGFGMGPLAEIVQALDRVQQPVQVLAVTGRNTDLRATLATRDYRHPTRVLGFVTNMHELMSVADLILTKPGGLTTSEALALGKPLFLWNPIPGQEAANSDFLLEHGAAAKVNRVDDLPFRLNQLLGSKKLRDMARAARHLGRPQAAKEVCAAAARLVNSSVP